MTSNSNREPREQLRADGEEVARAFAKLDAGVDINEWLARPENERIRNLANSFFEAPEYRPLRADLILRAFARRTESED
jgi:hypothetical protein